MPGKPCRARFVSKLARHGRLHGANFPSSTLLSSRRVLHLCLVLLLAAGAALFLVLGPARSTGGSSTAQLVSTDGLPQADGLALDGLALSDEDETISAAALGIEPMGQPVPVVLHQDGLSVSTVASASTVNEVLAEKGIVVEPGDYIFPLGGSPVTAGTHIYIYHANNIFLSVGGNDTMVRSRKGSVAEVLEEAGVTLGFQDRVEPPLDAPVGDGLTITVIRVREEVETSEEVIPRAVVYQDDPTMDMGQYTVLDWGADGFIRREYRVLYENDQEVQRELISEWEQPASDQIIAQGTRPVNIVQTPDGSLRYSYSLQMYATWYRPASAGRSADSPWYGLTATGVPVHRGIVAVDPSVIPLGTRLYVPGYGQAIAADTGSAVVGNIIDLGFADYEVPDWRTGWVEVYILE